MALSTKDVTTGGNGLSKIIEPGNVVVKVNSIELQRIAAFMTDAEGGYFLVYQCETKPLENFEGFFIDKDNESLGRYDGQIGSVKANRYYYKDGETKTGVVIKRDMEILRQLKTLCIAAGCPEWFEDADGKYNSIEEFVTALNTEKPFKDAFLNMCIGGKEYAKENNFIGYDLFLAKVARGTYQYEAEGKLPSKVAVFDKAAHVIALASTPAAGGGFAGDPVNGAPAVGNGAGVDLGDGNTQGGATLEGAPEFKL